MKRWYTLNTKPKNEERATHNLLSGGLEVLAPKLRIKKYKEGMFIYVIEPMFPNYIFARFHPVDDFRLVKYTRGIKTIVNFGGKIVPLHDEIIDFIKSRLDNGVAEITKKPFQKGEKVFIKEGPFKGFYGIFEQDLDGKERVAILLEGIHYCAKMEIDRDFVTGT
jgi:transcription elongation factor/antiterminator RfaH